MTDKRGLRTLSGAKLVALIGQSPMGALVEKEIARREKRWERKMGRGIRL